MADDNVTPLRPRHSLAAQLMLSLAALALLSVLAVGLPAIWLVRSQLQSQAWAQVQQGQQATAPCTTPSRTSWPAWQR
jgi:hypothetical protein